MDNVFLVLTLACTGGLIYSFIKKKNKKIKFGFAGAIIVFFILFGITTPEQAAKKETTKSSSSESTTKISNEKELVKEGSTKESSKQKKSESSINKTTINSKKTKNSSIKKETNSKLKSKIDISNNGPYQFSGMANITPEKATIKKDKMALYFEWRNDDGVADKRSFLGSGVSVVAYQNGQELERDTNSISGDDIKIKKNTSLEIDYMYTLTDDSPITVKLLPLEGNDQEFTFNIK